jgi:hypothetical protein
MALPENAHFNRQEEVSGDMDLMCIRRQVPADGRGFKTRGENALATAPFWAWLPFA